MNISLSEELEQQRKDKQRVQIYIDENCTPHGKLKQVEYGFIVLNQEEMKNEEMIIPIDQIRYVRILK